MICSKPILDARHHALKLLAVLILAGASISTVRANDFEQTCREIPSAVDAGFCNDETVQAADEQLRAIEEANEGVEVRQGPAGSLPLSDWRRALLSRCIDSACVADAYLARLAWHDGAPVQNPEAPPGDDQAKGTFEAGVADDCNASPSPVRNLICASETLRASDAYLETLASDLTSEAGRVIHADWKREVRDRCTTEGCLADAYMARLESVDRLLTEQQLASESSVEPTIEDSADQVLLAEPHPLAVLALLALPLLLLLTWFAGAMKWVAICYDFPDVLLAGTPLIAALCAPALIESIDGVGHKADAGAFGSTGTTVAIAIIGLTLLLNVRKAIAINRSVLIGLPVSLFRLFAPPITIFCAALLLLKARGRDERRYHHGHMELIHHRPTWLQQMLLLGFVLWLYHSVVNGKAVHARRGWI